MHLRAHVPEDTALFGVMQHGLAITEDHHDLVYTSHLYPGDDPDIIRNRINERIRKTDRLQARIHRDG